MWEGRYNATLIFLSSKEEQFFIQFMFVLLKEGKLFAHNASHTLHFYSAEFM